MVHISMLVLLSCHFVSKMYELVLKEKPTLLAWNYFKLQVRVDRLTLISYLLYHEQQMWEEVSTSKEGEHA